MQQLILSVFHYITETTVNFYQAYFPSLFYPLMQLKLTGAQGGITLILFLVLVLFHWM